MQQRRYRSGVIAEWPDQRRRSSYEMPRMASRRVIPRALVNFRSVSMVTLYSPRSVAPVIVATVWRSFFRPHRILNHFPLARFTGTELTFVRLHHEFLGIGPEDVTTGYRELL